MNYLIEVIIIFIALVILCRGFLLVSKKEQENQIVLAYMNTLQSYYQSIQHQIEITRQFRHDLSKHIQTLEAMMSRSGTDYLRDYANSLTSEYLEIQNRQLCDSEVVNSVISIKQSECRKKQITFETQIEHKAYDGVDEISLVGLLFNLLDNAIEENEKIADAACRKIRLCMNQQEKSIQIEVSNSIRSGKPLLFQTEKADKQSHGVGLTIIHYLVKKYHGTCHTKTDSAKNLFRISITLKSIPLGES